jgi:ribonucleoside-diphosphate reductase alpha chain
MPPEREGKTLSFRIASVKGFVTTGLFDDGRLGEVFLKLDQQGSTISGFCDCWSIAISLLLQRGSPLSEIVGKYKGQRFEPSGFTNYKPIPMTTSPVDFVVRWLDMHYGERKDES